ncbi:hypothetical protein [Streptomyces sp. NPDC058653]|uniref:hypothetical protein n=1 Tax=Streptomyces sp. NPDC058653 TaxID=3346576 RepID=UPI0036565765
MGECFFCGDPVDAEQVMCVELVGHGGRRAVDILSCLECVHRYRAFCEEGTTVWHILFTLALLGAPAAGTFAVGTRSPVLGGVTLVLVVMFAVSLVVMVRSDRRTTPRLTFDKGGWANRIGAHPEVAALTLEGWEREGHRSTANGPGGP